MKDIKKLSPRLRKKAKELLRSRIAHQPTSGKKLLADMKGFYAVELSYKDRIVYSIAEVMRRRFRVVSIDYTSLALSAG